MNNHDTRQVAFLSIILIFVIVPSIVYSQNFEDHDIDQFYKKVELEDGILNEEGEEIDFILTKESMEDGKYEVEITDGPGELYRV
jgi:spore germination protein GerM